MTCLCCQRRFEIHTKNELVDCIEWVEDKHHIRSEQVRHVSERIEYLKKYGKNIYKSSISLNDIIKELETHITIRGKGIV